MIMRYKLKSLLLVHTFIFCVAGILFIGCATVRENHSGMETVTAKVLTPIRFSTYDGEDAAGNPTFIGENTVIVLIVEPDGYAGIKKEIEIKFGIMREVSGWIDDGTEWYPVNSYVRFKVPRKHLNKFHILGISTLKDIESVQYTEEPETE